MACAHYGFVFLMKMKVGERGRKLVEQLLHALHFIYTKLCAPRTTLTMFFTEVTLVYNVCFMCT